MSPFSIENPEQFLAEKSIERRKKQNISIDESDLPVNSFYLDSLIQKGAKIIHTSKWLNSAAIEADTSIVQEILKLSFVVAVKPVFGTRILQSKNQQIQQSLVKTDNHLLESSYGKGLRQIEMQQGLFLHQLRLKGKGILIGVFDSGFLAVDVLGGFQHLFSNQQIVDTWDFVNQQGEVFNFDTHGTFVLSIIATKQENELIGTAPEANFLLYRTEDVRSEFSIEEDHWVAAAERADSIGVDVINTSLGYSIFDDDTMNYAYSDMDGKTTRISQAAHWAARKGILLVTSAGNEGNTSWRFITAPGDADSILSVGSVNDALATSPFSSRGPSYDQRIKPDIAAMGQATAFLSLNETVETGSGTSFAAPIITGLAASLWQGLPQKSAMEILEIIKKSAHQYLQPNNEIGFGIPDFKKAFLENMEKSIESPLAFPLIFPNPFQQKIHINMLPQSDDDLEVAIYDYSGKIIVEKKFKMVKDDFVDIAIEDLSDRGSGMFYLKLKSSTFNELHRIVKF